MAERKPIPIETERQVLTLCRRRCALCFGLNGDATVKQGQIAHLDRDPGNNDPANLAFLCPNHHDEYDSRPSTTKRFTAGELSYYREELHEFSKEIPRAWLDQVSGETTSPRSDQAHRASTRPALFDKRLKIYEAVRTFYAAVLGDGISLPTLHQFANDTDLAEFLFDPPLVDHLRELYRQGVKLYVTYEQLKHPPLTPLPQSVFNEHHEALQWLASQTGPTKQMFVERMRILE